MEGLVLNLLRETLYFILSNIYPHHYRCCVLPQLMDAKLIIIYFFGYSEILKCMLNEKIYH